MAIDFTPLAAIELDEAMQFYEAQISGLGKQFIAEFRRTIRYVSIMPYAWRKVGDHTRRVNIKKFPYLVLYVIDGKNILITCVAHQHRDPKFYLERTG